jgi:hypothetical protein
MQPGHFQGKSYDKSVKFKSFVHVLIDSFLLDSSNVA